MKIITPQRTLPSDNYDLVSQLEAYLHKFANGAPQPWTYESKPTARPIYKLYQYHLPAPVRDLLERIASASGGVRLW